MHVILEHVYLRSVWKFNNIDSVRKGLCYSMFYKDLLCSNQYA